MTRIAIAALVILAAWAYVVVFMSVPNEPRRYHNDRSNLQQVKP